MLVLQALVGAFATGAASASPMLDAFGNPLCITSSESASTGSSDHTGMPDCCTTTCSMVAPAIGTDRLVHSLANPLVISAPASFDATPKAALPAPDHDPGNPRAPPLKG